MNTRQRILAALRRDPGFRSMLHPNRKRPPKAFLLNGPGSLVLTLRLPGQDRAAARARLAAARRIMERAAAPARLRLLATETHASAGELWASASYAVVKP